MRRAWVVAALLGLALAGCQRSDSPDIGYAATSLPISVGATPVTTSAASSGGCTVVAGKADRRCTPGAANPAVTKDNLAQTICAPSPAPGQETWTASQRPPSAYTTGLKRRQLIEFSEPGSIAQYKEDHLIALEIGGAPKDPHNLFPQPTADAKRKDADERALHAAVCSGAMTLADAQAQMAQQWTH